MEKDLLLVTIRCITYNHEPYIRQCLEGFVMQKTNFRFEAIVHDDASTDRTADIIREYADKYPEIIKPIYETENQYSKKDGSLTRIMDEHTKGKYVAFCEGDDYWIDPLKLQKQVEFLEKNLDYGLCHSNYTLVDQNNESLLKINNKWESGDVLDLYLNGKYHIATLTTVFRRKLYESIDRGEYVDYVAGDLSLFLEMAYRTKVKYMDEKTAAYRVLPNSASHSDNSNKLYNFHKSNVELKIHFSKKYNLAFSEEKAMCKLYQIMLKEAYLKEDAEEARYYYKKMIQKSWKSLFYLRELLFLLATSSKMCRKFVSVLYKLKK